MSKLINSSSFIETGRRTTAYGDQILNYIDGTVEVTLRGVTKRVDATMMDDGIICARGLVGRYNTGSKSWPAVVTEHKTGSGEIVEIIRFGRDDRSPSFQKRNLVYFAD